MTAEEEADADTLATAATVLRSVVREDAPQGTAGYGLFALARLLDELARCPGPDAGPPIGPREAGLEIARHILDHGVVVTAALPASRSVRPEPSVASATGVDADGVSASSGGFGEAPLADQLQQFDP